MTDGGDSPHNRDGSERSPEDPDERPTDGDSLDQTDRERWTQPASADTEADTASSPAQTPTPEATGQQTDSTQRADRQTSPPLGEPTPRQIARIQARASTLDRSQTTEYTTDLRSLDSIVQLHWGIRTAIGAFVLGTIASVILASVGVPAYFGTTFVGLFLVVGSLLVVLRYRAWAYQIRADSLYLERGVVTHVRSIVPYVRIQHVDTSRSPLERALGLSTLVVYTAGSRGADVSVPGLKPDEARDLQRRLKELAIESEGDDAL